MARSLDWIDPAARDWLVSLGIRDVVDAWRDDLPGEIINDRGDRQVLRLAHSEIPAVTYLKRWRFPEGSKYLRRPGAAALRNRARAELRNLRKLARIGVVCPRPLAFGEKRTVWGATASLLLLEDMAGYQSAADFLDASPESASRVVVGVARVMADLHAHGLFYRSPGLKHFYVPLTGSEDAPLGLLDVPRLDHKPNLLMRFLRNQFNLDTPGVARDLSKVLMGFGDYLDQSPRIEERFWEAYLGALPAKLRWEGVREEVRGALEKRTESRRLRAIRKSERGE